MVDTTFSRRNFLSAGAVLGLGLTSSTASACFRRRRCSTPVESHPALRVRYNVASLNGRQIESLRRGVAAMKALPATDPRSWRFQANIHGTHDPVTSPLFNQCEHGTLLFLAWHRGYLYFFERILRRAAGDPSLTLPYWDWTTSPVLPAAFRTPASSTNPLFDSTRAINDGSALPPQVVVDDLKRALDLVPFPPAGPIGFSRSLEGSPHGAVHVYVGGNMGSVPTAANDPIFWLHHGNIDRIWDHWLNLAGGRMNPSDSAFLEKSYPFADEDGTVVTVKVRDILGSAQLGYRYDHEPPPPVLAADTPAKEPDRGAMSIRAASSEKEDKAPGAEGKPLGLKRETVKLHVVDRHAPALKVAVEGSRGARPGKIQVEIEGLSVAEVPNYSYGVYLNLPEGDVPAERARLYHVGTINFFGRDHGGKPGHGHAERSFTETFDATAVVARLQQDGRWKPEAISVTLLPITPIAPKGGEQAVRQRSEESARRAKITYRRVSLLIAP